MSGKKKINPTNPRSKKIEKPVCERDRTIRKEKVDFHITEESVNSTAVPVDYTFKRYTEIEQTSPAFASRARLGKVNLGPHKKFLSRSLWLNHNLIRNIKNIENMVDSVIEYPERLGFLDISHNQLKDIDEGVFKFKNLKVLYLHDNKISEMEEVFKLRQLKQLQHLTLYGNPFYENRRLGNIRTVIKYLLPQIKKLDYNRLAGIETEMAVCADVLRFLEEKEGRVPNYIPSKRQAGDNRGKIQTTHVKQGIPDLDIECDCNPTEEYY